MHRAFTTASLFVLLCLTPVRVFAQSPASSSAMDERMRACTSCHGVQGQGRSNDYFPRIAGKPADYLFNQLSAFRDGGRTYPPMSYLLAFLTDEDLRRIAQYFAGFQPPYPDADTAAVPPDVLDHGKQLVMNGDASRKLPACAACHGARLTGAKPGVPGLLGLHASYIAGQMGTWRSGTRHALAPDCMHEIAVKLNDRDIYAVSSWLARQPRPDDPWPSPPGDLKLPLACGSQMQ
ncbi:cytochrome c553 [Paraburkholderia atlantica]